MFEPLCLRLTAFLLLAAALPSQHRAVDLLLRGGQLYEAQPYEAQLNEAGTDSSQRRGDVAIAAGRIVAVGDCRGITASRELDCRGQVVAPGFIDVHAHVDADVARHPDCENYLRMGVTTLITGNCGGSVPDLAKHFERVERGGIGVNYGSLVGLGTVRTAVLGTKNRPPDDFELAAMCALVDAGMQAGAFGVSTGLIYVPGTYASTQEIAALARVAARHGGLYATHMRNENDEVLQSIAEVLAIGRIASLPVHVSHIKCTARPNWGRAGEVLAALRAARAEGVRVTADQYAYDASSTGLDVVFPSAALAIGREEFGRRLRTDAAFRAEMKQALFTTMDKVGFGDFRYARIASAAGNPDLSGMTIPEASKQRLGRDDRDAQAELAMELFAAAAPKRVSMVYHTIGEQDVATFMAEPWIAIAADAGLRVDVGGDKPHPRGAGNNPRVLGRYVRELGVLDLQTAVRKMTRVPAEAFGLRDRGAITVGSCADLVVFDPATVSDMATYREPMLPPRGIKWVVVNGTIAVENGTTTASRAGHVLRRR